MDSSDILGGIFVVGTERDCHEPEKSRGAIIMETYTGRANLVETVKNGKRFHRYGGVTVFKLEKVGTLEECENIINKAIT